MPDPVRGDRIDQRERDAEDEVDPELGPFGHRAPDDRERDAGEDDLEQVGAGAWDRREERVRRFPDRQHRVDRRREAVRADDAVAVAERNSEADKPVDERADSEDEDVLAGDVRGVLHSRQARLEEGEAGLHEHDEDRIGHGGATAARDRPVGLCMARSMRLEQTSPSPDSLPLRAETAIAATTAAAISSSTMNVSRAFGRKRDSNTRPRYSGVTPRWRPWPIASTTVTPTWPVSSSTASITVSTRSRITTASTLITGFSSPVGRRPSSDRSSGRAARGRRPRGTRTASAPPGSPRFRGTRRSRASTSRPLPPTRSRARVAPRRRP